jgi:hypothetical protein
MITGAVLTVAVVVSTSAAAETMRDLAVMRCLPAAVMVGDLSWSSGYVESVGCRIVRGDVDARIGM